MIIKIDELKRIMIILYSDKDSNTVYTVYTVYIHIKHFKVFIFIIFMFNLYEGLYIRSVTYILY